MAGAPIDADAEWDEVDDLGNPWPPDLGESPGEEDEPMYTACHTHDIYGFTAPVSIRHAHKGEADHRHPPLPPRGPAWARRRPLDPTTHTDEGLRPSLAGLTTALHLAAVELRLTTEAVLLLPDPQQQLAWVPVLEAINFHIGFAARGVERLVGLVSATEDERSGG